jgi:hypothetical protein
MSKYRKLQQEIELTLKKVELGCAEWEALWRQLEGVEVRHATCNCFCF